MFNFIKNTAIRRLVYLIVGFIFYAVIGYFQDAKADTFPADLKFYYYTVIPVGSAQSINNICASLGPIQYGSAPYTYHGETHTLFGTHPEQDVILRCYFSVSTGGNPPSDIATDVQTTYSCPYGVLSGKYCTGEPPPPCNDGERTEFPRGAYSITKTLPTSGCVAGCAVLVQKSPRKIECGGGGVMLCGYIQDVSVVKTGQTCTGTNINPPSPEPVPERADSEEAKCLNKGKNYGYVGGNVVCTAKGQEGSEGADKPPETDTKTTNNPDGSTTTKTTTTKENADGTITKETTIVNTPAGGGTPTTETETEEQDFGGFCEDNPNSKLCEESEDSNFSGSCESSFNCDGDAVQCAIAKKQHQARCDDLTTDTTSDLGASIIAGQDSTQGEEGSFSNPMQVGFDDFDDSSFLSKSCLPDIQTSTYGSIPISQLCTGLEAAGAIVLAFAYLIGLGIIFKGF